MLGERFPLLHITWFQHCSSSVSRKTWTHTHSIFVHRLGTLYMRRNILPERRKTCSATTVILIRSRSALQASRCEWTTGRAPLDQALCEHDDAAAPSKDLPVRRSSSDHTGTNALTF